MERKQEMVFLCLQQSKVNSSLPRRVSALALRDSAAQVHRSFIKYTPLLPCIRMAVRVLLSFRARIENTAWDECKFNIDTNKFKTNVDG